MKDNNSKKSKDREYSKKYYQQNKRKCGKKVLDRSRLKKNLPSKIYSAQKSNSSMRGMEPPEYTREELKEWLYNQAEYHILYDKWEASGYATDKIPSVDRTNSKIGYTWDNITLMTWRDNKYKAYEKGEIGRRNKGVEQLELDSGEVIATYSSITIAAEITGISINVIWKIMNKGLGRSKSKYLFRYK